MNQPRDTAHPYNLPQHVAIIMDGNGRWAKKQGFDRSFGHQNAIKSVRAAIETCGDMGIPYLSLFAFSSENWKRPKLEVSFLMKLLAKTIEAEIQELHDKGIRLLVIGETDALPEYATKPLQHAIDLTKDNTKATLVIALNYGSQNEILHASREIAKKVKSGELNPEEIDQQIFEENLYTQNIPNVDLLIRTSGEYRISNFLLWQIAYAELYFTDVLWPDFRKEHFMEALEDYSKRERRYGKTGEQIKTE
ncbi:isoprenyl transferase [Moheibacter sp.]|uniref:isoprenyl transferase n=1 Tax=Moheibacter sp. TaxID=1965316 RepID=UPI003C75F685